MVEVQISLLDRLVDLDRSASTPLYQQLYEDLRRGIVDSRLPRKTRLPSTRRLAETLEVSRNTVIKAFDQLRSEGYLTSEVGSGTYVAKTLPERHTQVYRPTPGPDQALHVPDYDAATRSLSGRMERLMERPISLVDDPVGQHPFRPGIPAFDAFPIETWSKLASRRWRTLPANQLEYGDPAGYPPLREAVAEYLRTARGANCEAEQVIIVSGIQQAFTLVGRAFLDPGDEVCVEDPGFPRMRGALTAVGAEVHSVPVDDEGFAPTAVPDAAAPRLVGVTPSHQYPLGITMSVSRRQELLRWGSDHDIWILEDDYDSEYRYSGQPIAALQGMDTDGRVLYAGTFSKVLFPALRLGYLVVPPTLVEPIVKLRTVSDRCPPRVDQMILTDFMEEGHFEQHIRKMRTLYSERQAVLLEALDEHLDGFLDADPSNAGLHLVGRLPEGVDDQRVADRLAEHDLLTLPLSFYAEHPLDRGGLLLGYAGIPDEDLRRAVRRMAEVLTPFREQVRP